MPSITVVDRATFCTSKNRPSVNTRKYSLEPSGFYSGPDSGADNLVPYRDNKILSLIVHFAARNDRADLDSHIAVLSSSGPQVRCGARPDSGDGRRPFPAMPQLRGHELEYVGAISEGIAPTYHTSQKNITI